ncbi:proline-rich receptor-like protein kinase PERK10 [Dioscorea cayenensis subsp. rotundata]|uniref:Proline-rich receptor-like protein kinase PERK10 n=1 Tax=Dioscorea cayennensis subsp. rotundata TaxID=55577 RepID=A0AB40BJF3_DIOCR|nr:proline-rich receptor-like protein kinase PERK10 [Dioscorea cayenensis subsp. rotundata]
MKMKKEEEKKRMVGEIGSRGSKEEEEEGKTVVVGIRMDQQSRELLTWALVKVASPGDRVIALHILPSSSTESSGMDGKSSSCLISSVKNFDSILSVYDGFCNLKQINLKLKVCRGSSIRKVLVQEVNSYSASKLILGVSKNNSIIGPSSTSVAKYCAKKLSAKCSVLAVNNGKVVYQREASQENHKVSSIQLNASRNSCKLPKDRTGKLYCVLPDRRQSGRISNASNLSIVELNDTSQTENCSLCSPSNLLEMKEESSLALVPIKESSNNISLSTDNDLIDMRPGWPLLRGAIMNDMRTSMEKSKGSVVQWAMMLPSRCSVSAPPPHSDFDHMKTEQNALLICDADTNSSSSPVETHEEEVKFLAELECIREKYSSVYRLFTYNELKQATSDLSPEKLAGRGGSSRVYKGCLSDGRELAVKMLKPSEDALKEFTSEIEIITSLHHKNIISLFGFCFENNNLILVYDFLSRGSLEECLHGEQESKVVVSWVDRFKIATAIAEALDYLHGDCNGQPVIHRDVKSSNILLADDFEPQLSDFGLAKWASESTEPITCSDVAGTFGYLAPEYFMHGKVSEKIDVYAFGVVLLELLSGRKPIITGSSNNQESLVIWAKNIMQEGKIKQLVDPSLGDEYDDDQVERTILAASLCIRRASRSRPRIGRVLKLLQGEDDAVSWARTQAGTLEEFDDSDDEVISPPSNLQSYIKLALLGVEDDSHSISSIEANTYFEDYLQGRWSRSSSFD